MKYLCAVYFEPKTLEALSGRARSTSSRRHWKHGQDYTGPQLATIEVRPVMQLSAPVEPRLTFAGAWREPWGLDRFPARDRTSLESRRSTPRTAQTKAEAERT
jgi:hypothetical protein